MTADEAFDKVLEARGKLSRAAYLTNVPVPEVLGAARELESAWNAYESELEAEAADRVAGKVP